MIDFNEKDTNLTKVRSESKLFNLVTRYKYRVYGLRQNDNPAVLIEYHYDRVDDKFKEKLEALCEFLKANGIEIDTYSESDNPNRVDIGLRKDLRIFVNKNDKPMLASSILSTIIYCLEGRIDLDQLKKFKLSAIPKLPVEPVTPPAA
jgi:hypothetical protein